MIPGEGIISDDRVHLTGQRSLIRVREAGLQALHPWAAPVLLG